MASCPSNPLVVPWQEVAALGLGYSIKAVVVVMTLRLRVALQLRNGHDSCIPGSHRAQPTFLTLAGPWENRFKSWLCHIGGCDPEQVLKPLVSSSVSGWGRTL